MEPEMTTLPPTNWAFWNAGLSSACTLDATAKPVPGEPSPLYGEYSSKALRAEQLALLRTGFPLGLVPSYSPPSNPELGSLALQTLIPGPFTQHWWTSFIAQVRPKMPILSVKDEVMVAFEESDTGVAMSAAMDCAKRFMNKSLYSLGFFSLFPIALDTSLLFNIEEHGESKKRFAKASLIHNLEKHAIRLEAAWPGLFLDREGTYWNVPFSLSLDASSTNSRSGFKYHFGLQKNDGQPHALNSSTTDAPSVLLPGLCAKATFTYEKRKDLWRVKKRTRRSKRSYDVRLKQPRCSIYGLIGGSCAVWFDKNRNLDAGSTGAQLDDRETQLGNLGFHSFSPSIRKNPFSADLFGSLRYTYQHGRFTKYFNDLTRLDARIDLPSAVSSIKGASNVISNILGNKTKKEVDLLSSPRLGMILQQQVLGPIVARVESRITFNSPTGGFSPRVEDALYGISYSLSSLRSAKVLAWYSPKRKEGMVELRFYEF